MRWWRAAFLGVSANLSADSPFTIGDVNRLVRERGIRSGEELLRHLPRKFRENFTFVAQSASSQTATPEAPRAILFGRDASLVLAFNGRDQSVEMAQYRSGDPPSLEFRELSFPRDGTGAPTLSGANPDKCKTCHGDPAGYIR
jgi:hypothetical protein